MENRAEGEARGRPIGLDDLIALNDEIVALTRTGIPLERGLLAIGTDLPGRLKGIATVLGHRMSQGESLAVALENSGGNIPRVYRAVVEAGLRSGRLPMALEGLATYARGYAEARRSILLALWYPLLVLGLVYVLFIAIVTGLIPRFVATFETMGVAVQWSLRILQRLGESAWIWGPILPAGLAILVLVGLATGRAGVLGGRGLFGVLRRLPWTGTMLRSYEAASFADTLALLIEHQVTYPHALILAGEASGDPALATSTHAMAEAIRAGQPPMRGQASGRSLPPLLQWIVARGAGERDTIGALRSMAGRYRGEARTRSELLRVMLPTLLLFGIAATATFLYALALFVPLTTLWSGLSDEAP